jgi:putative protease
VGRDFVELDGDATLAAGDGIVFDTGGDTNAEQGGRIFAIRGRRLSFQHGHLDFSRIHPGDRVWKTDDPALEKRLRQSFAGNIEPRRRESVALRVSGKENEPLVMAGHGVRAASNILLQPARTAPLTDDKLREHLGRFGDSPYVLGEMINEIEGALILPIGELNRVRREFLFQLQAASEITRNECSTTWREMLQPPSAQVEVRPSQLTVLCRTMEQIEAALTCGIQSVYVDFEDIRRYKDAVALVRSHSAVSVFLATPRIQKAGEQGFFKLIENAAPDGVLIRNLGAIGYFGGSASENDRPPLRLIGDFSLNVANPLTAQHFLGKGLERVTISCDLNVEQVLDLLHAVPGESLELTLHQHMPMFHMEHCVFAAFLSKGSSFLDCGRPCESHRVRLRDRVGMEHPLRADVGCRNTLFNAVPQTGARFFSALEDAGLHTFRIELLEESARETQRVIRSYQALLQKERAGEDLWRELKAQSQLGVTRGTL